jgi:hypothetical protein
VEVADIVVLKIDRWLPIDNKTTLSATPQVLNNYYFEKGVKL